MPSSSEVNPSSFRVNAAKRGDGSDAIWHQTSHQCGVSLILNAVFGSLRSVTKKYVTVLIATGLIIGQDIYCVYVSSYNTRELE